MSGCHHIRRKRYAASANSPQCRDTPGDIYLVARLAVIFRVKGAGRVSTSTGPAITLTQEPEVADERYRTRARRARQTHDLPRRRRPAPRHIQRLRQPWMQVRPLPHRLVPVPEGLASLMRIRITWNPYDRWTSHSRKHTWWPRVAHATVWLCSADSVRLWETRCIKSLKPTRNIYQAIQ
jgi:hypothetical protein